MYEEPMILNTICTLLIKGNKTSSEYFPWYQKAVEEDFRIARLYEYYMIAMDETCILCMVIHWITGKKHFYMQIF